MNQLMPTQNDIIMRKIEECNKLLLDELATNERLLDEKNSFKTKIKNLVEKIDIIKIGPNVIKKTKKAFIKKSLIILSKLLPVLVFLELLIGLGLPILGINIFIASFIVSITQFTKYNKETINIRKVMKQFNISQLEYNLKQCEEIFSYIQDEISKNDAKIDDLKKMIRDLMEVKGMFKNYDTSLKNKGYLTFEEITANHPKMKKIGLDKVI